MLRGLLLYTSLSFLGNAFAAREPSNEVITTKEDGREKYGTQ